MLDPEIKLPNGLKKNLSAITFSQSSRALWLSSANRDKESVECCCVSPGIPMGVGFRKVNGGVYYLHNLHAADAARHHSNCPHKGATSTDDDRAKPVYKVTEDGGVDLLLDAVLSRTDGDGRRNFSEERAELNQKADLILEALLFKSGMCVWSPQIAEKRSYIVMRYRMVEAAKQVLISGTPISGQFFMPPKFSRDKQDEIQSEVSEMFDLLKKVDNEVARFVCVGLIKEVVDNDDGKSVTIRFAESAVKYKAWNSEAESLGLREKLPEGWRRFSVFLIEAPSGRYPYLVAGATCYIGPKWEFCLSRKMVETLPPDEERELMVTSITRFSD